MTDVGAPPSTSINPDGVPDALTDYSQWLLWSPVRKPDKWDKQPRDAAAPDTDHGIDATDSANLTGFSTAADAVTDRDDRGLGFTFMTDGPLVGVDLDDCRDPDTGELTERAETIVESLESYAEVSPSGTGVHVIVRGELTEDDRNRNNDVEVYDRGRYFTVTGDHLEGTPATITDGGLALDGLLADLEDDRDDGEADRPAHTTGSDGENRPPADRSDGFDGSDRALVAKAKDAKNGDKFARLWEFAGGPKDSPAGYDSHSEADLALCGLLAFWTGGDRRRIDDLFRQSGLYREKWDRDDYRERTIGKALEGRTEFYSPGGSTQPSPATDGGATTGSRSGASTDDPSVFKRPSPSAVKAVAGLGEDDDLSSLTDRQKAYYAWQWITDHRDLLAAQPDGTLYACHDGVWKPDGEQALRVIGSQLLGPEWSRNVGRELIERVRASAPVDHDDLGAPAGTIAVEHGLLDVADRTLRNLRPDDYALTRLPIEYDPDADCPRFREFLDDVCRSGDLPKIQEFIGYCLEHWTAERKKALMLFGPTDSGKTVFCTVIERLFGEDNTAAVSPQYLANERWGIADLEGQVMNVRHDLDPGVIEQPGPLKELISGDRVMAERKGQDRFPMEPTAKHLWAANRAPQLHSEDDALLNRFLVAEFPRTIPKAEQASRGDLLADLTDELPGILNWALSGLARLRDQGQFTGERYPGDVADLWKEYGSSVERFAEHCVEQADGEKIPKDRVYAAYKRFVAENDLTQRTQDKLTRELKGIDGVGDDRRRFNGRRKSAYIGLRLTEDAPDHTGTGDDRDGNQSRFGDR